MAEAQITWAPTAFTTQAYMNILPPRTLESEVARKNLEHQLHAALVAREQEDELMDIAQVEIRPILPGFHRFISVWAVRDALNVLVDVGPASGGEGLLADLEAIGFDRLDYIWITHIHMDHCGALAQVLHRFPEAKVICHEKAVPHLEDPARLWEATRQVLGDVGQAYGAPARVPKEKLISHSAAAVQGLRIIETPGHAVHHLSFTYKGSLFIGEAGGNFTPVGNAEYLRPATPPKLHLDVFLGSVDRLIQLGEMPVYYGHFGQAENSVRLLRVFRAQVEFWKRTVSDLLAAGHEGVEEKAMQVLIEKDPRLKAFALMDVDMQRRERFFMMNSVKGFAGYLKEKGP